MTSSNTQKLSNDTPAISHLIGMCGAGTVIFTGLFLLFMFFKLPGFAILAGMVASLCAVGFKSWWEMKYYKPIGK